MPPSSPSSTPVPPRPTSLVSDNPDTYTTGEAALNSLSTSTAIILTLLALVVIVAVIYYVTLRKPN